MKLAIYGGSFNPPHLGHRHVVETVVDQIQPDQLWVIPTSTPPHKELTADSAEEQDRLAMTRLAFEGLDQVSVSDMEIQRGGHSYTCDTVREMRALFPDAQLFLIVGTDMLCTFREWHEYQWILQECTLVALARDEDWQALETAAESLRAEDHAQVVLLRAEVVEVSSTEIRKAIADGKKPDTIAPSVFRYIQTHHLYGWRETSEEESGKNS